MGTIVHLGFSLTLTKKENVHIIYKVSFMQFKTNHQGKITEWQLNCQNIPAKDIYHMQKMLTIKM